METTEQMFDDLNLLRKQVIFLQEQLLELSHAVVDASKVMEAICKEKAESALPFTQSEIFTLASDWVNKYTEEKWGFLWK